MNFVIVGPTGSGKCTWSSYALLRDNVQHFIEKGEPGPRFRALHGLERAVDEGAHRVSAARLRGELLRACVALRQVDLQNAAISVRTRALLTGSATRPETRDTAQARAMGWELPLTDADTTPVPRAARDFVGVVLALTANAVDGDMIEIRAEGAAPRFVPANEVGAAS